MDLTPSRKKPKQMEFLSAKNEAFLSAKTKVF